VLLFNKACNDLPQSGAFLEQGSALIFILGPDYTVNAADIEAFIDKMKNKDNGQTITVNGNRLEIRYDKASGQSWIDVSNDNDERANTVRQGDSILHLVYLQYRTNIGDYYAQSHSQNRFRDFQMNNLV
jgi:hypothetical protein